VDGRKLGPGAAWLAGLGAAFAIGCATTPALPPTALVRLKTTMGEIDVEVETERAPVTASNFLRCVAEGRYDGGRFHRTVRPDTEVRKDVPIEVIQAGPSPRFEGSDVSPIPLERTNATGLRHVDGAVSMARGGPDSATSDFFVCVGPQPSLDFGGARNPDGQGFAVFGRVTRGGEVVRRIQAAKAEGQALTPPVEIVSARRLR
jgi:peptidyl-prolyl cis-trans isomerase A (cyclophilin A)